MIKHIYKLFIFIFLLFISNYSFSETYMDQWEDSDKSYLDLIEQGYRVIRFDNRDIGLSTKFTELSMFSTLILFIKLVMYYINNPDMLELMRTNH